MCASLLPGLKLGLALLQGEHPVADGIATGWICLIATHLKLRSTGSMDTERSQRPQSVKSRPQSSGIFYWEQGNRTV